MYQANATMAKLLSLLILCAVTAGIASADEFVDVSPGNFHLMNFGISERAMFQPSYSGANLTTALSWNPELDLTEEWTATGTVSVFGLSATDKTFPAFRLLAGVAYQGLHPLFFPELQLGTEVWPRSYGGAYFTTALNLHYRIRLSTDGLGQYLDSVWLGYQTLFVPSNFGNQIVLGLRISFSPRAVSGYSANSAHHPSPVAMRDLDEESK